MHKLTERQKRNKYREMKERQREDSQTDGERKRQKVVDR